ncbi:MAG: prolipoprotein diacylglyceryl transferase [Oscillospiraceae bacterium]|nr:prolipoprotein diacylglyceryl transferase [Oscillospiraceae bacterium]
MTVERLSTNEIVFPGLGIELKISPDAFTIGSFAVKWYGICIAVGLLLAIIYCFRRTKEFGLSSDRLNDAVFAGFLGAVVNARLYYVIFHLDSYHTIKDIISIRDGGLAIYGGIIGALVIGFIACKIRKVNVLAAFDIASMGFFIGQGIGRWGNFFNQEAFGCNTSLPWGMSGGRIQQYLANYKDYLYANNGIVVDPFQTVHPTFLYESVWCLLGFLLLHFIHKKRKFDGEIILIYVMWYGAGRAVIEGLRTDSLMLGSFRVSQLLAVVSAVAAAVIFVIARVRVSKTGARLYRDSEESHDILEQEAMAEQEEKAAKAARKEKTLSADQKIIDEDDEEEAEESEE